MIFILQILQILWYEETDVFFKNIEPSTYLILRLTKKIYSQN